MKKPIRDINIPNINDKAELSFKSQPHVIPPKKDKIIPP